MTDKSYRLQVRIPEPLSDKGRILAAVLNVSYNQLILDAIAEKVDAWEKGHGALPIAPPE